MPRVIGNLAQAIGPAIAAAGKDLDGIVDDVDLGSVSVEFDLVNPALARRHFIDGGGESRLYEARISRFDAGPCRVLTQKRHTATPLRKTMKWADREIVPYFKGCAGVTRKYFVKNDSARASLQKIASIPRALS